MKIILMDLLGIILKRATRQLLSVSRDNSLYFLVHCGDITYFCLRLLSSEVGEPKMSSIDPQRRLLSFLTLSHDLLFLYVGK